MRKAWLITVVTGFLLLMGTGVQGEGCDLLWQYVSPMPTGPGLYKVTYGKGQYVGADRAKACVTSTDGVVWRRSLPNNFTALSAFAFGNSLYMGMGGSRGSFRICISSDGNNWQSYSLDDDVTKVEFSALIRTGDFFFGLDGNRLYRSADGIQWSSAVTPSTSGFGVVDVVYGLGVYVAVDATGYYYTSRDGAGWTQNIFPYPGYFWEITFGGGRFVAVADGTETLLILSSSDAVSWTIGAYSPVVTWDCFAIYGAGQFFLFDKAYGKGMSSVDGTAWTNFDVPVDMSDVIWDGTRFLAAQVDHVRLSYDGRTWEDDYSIIGPARYQGVIASESPRMFVAFGAGGVATSVDGRAWSFSPQPELFDVASGGGRLVGVGRDWQIFTSDDGETWNASTVPPMTGPNRVAFGSSLFIAIGASGTILTSPDGDAWTRRDAGVQSHLTSIAYGNGRFVAGGNDGVLITSVDGINWTRSTGPDPSSMVYSIAFGNGLFVVGTNWAKMLVGTDGLNWQSVSNGDIYTPIRFAGGRFFRTGYASPINSADGINWVRNSWSMGAIMPGLAFNGSLYVAAGDNSLMYAVPACLSTVTSVVPATVPVDGGTTVSVRGSHFTAATEIRFGGTPATEFRVISDEEISAVTPAHGAAGVYVTVTTPGGTSLGADSNYLVFGTRPVITAVKKLKDPYRLQVSGSGFTLTSLIRINGAPAPSSTYKNESTVIAKKGDPLKSMLPPGLAAQIVVVNSDTGVASRPFTYTP